MPKETHFFLAGCGEGFLNGWERLKMVGDQNDVAQDGDG